MENGSINRQKIAEIKDSILESKVDNNQISSQEAHKILNSEYDKHVEKLLPLFRTFKV